MKIFLFILLISCFQTQTFSQTNNDTEDATPIDKPRVRLVILNTTDVTISQNLIDRVRDIGEYIENYYVSELTTKGYTLGNTHMLARNTDGDILVYLATSTQSSSDITNLTVAAINLAKTTYTDLTDLNTIWAVVHFKSGGGFRGGGKVDGGSMRFELKDASGAIDFTSNMAQTNYHRDISLKAIHHELGHALTLLHNGPLRTNTTFNTLMGPINQVYENTVNIAQTADIQLSDYTAAIIAYHPIFRDTAFDIAQLADKTMRIEKIMGDDDLFTVDCTTGIAHITGKVTSNLPFHAVVIRLTYDNLGLGGYWNKSFAVPPDSNGVFDLKLIESSINISPSPQNDFQYEVMVAFDNGLSTGVNQLGVNESITTSKNRYISDYSFDITPSTTQNITLMDSTLSTNYSDAISYQWLDCDNNYEPILGANAQSYTFGTNGNYAVKIRTITGCTHTSNCYNTSTVGVNDYNITSDLLDIYPNPSNGNFFIQSIKDKIKSIEIYSISGQIILQKEFREGKNIVPIEFLREGLHILHLKTDKETYETKIFIYK